MDTEQDWREVPADFTGPSIAHRHQHADGRRCTKRAEWVFETDDSPTGVAVCLRGHKSLTRPEEV